MITLGAYRRGNTMALADSQSPSVYHREVCPHFIYDLLKIQKQACSIYPPCECFSHLSWVASLFIPFQVSTNQRFSDLVDLLPY